MRCAVYISSRRDFSHAVNRRAAAHDMRAADVGHENSSKLEPAVFRVRTFMYFLAGPFGEAGTVTDPRT